MKIVSFVFKLVKYNYIEVMINIYYIILIL